jgi:hypothetical protein
MIMIKRNPRKEIPRVCYRTISVKIMQGQYNRQQGIQIGIVGCRNIPCIQHTYLGR